MIKRKYSIREDNEFLILLSRNIQDDFNAMIEPGFYIEFENTKGHLIIKILGENSLVKKIDEFSNHLVNHYKAELV